VKSNSALRAIRESNYVISDRVNYYKTLNNNNFQAVLLRFGQNKTEYISAAQLDGYRTERGRIIGFEDETRQLAIPRISGGNFDSFAHHGAGLLGSTPFIYMNTGLRSRNANGGINTARTFSVAVLKDLLCRELPVIWYQDAVPKLQASSSLAYRTSHSCNQCHVTMDPLAYVVRNKHFFAVGNAQDPLDAPLASVQVRVTDQSSDSGDIVDEPDPVFFRRAPTGKLYIRSLANDNYPYINGITMNGIPGLGNQLAQTFDLYLCAASRYFEFLTGYSMDFYAHDTSNPSSDRPAYNSDQMELLNYLRARASELQNHMDLQLMIKEMVNSPYY
jgi:hypothetical protein